jgi:hypothetical protein
MPELSSLLRQRLQAAESARLQHPDADTLTAYLEQLLPLPERKLVLEHIAVCSDCREVIFLATPENAAVAGPESQVPEALVPDAAAAAIPARRRWFLTPGFGLAASIAAMAAAVTLVIEIPHRNQPLTPTSAPVRVEDKLSKLEPPPIPATSPSAAAAVGNSPVASPAGPASQSEVATAKDSKPGTDIRIPESRALSASEAGVAAKKAKVEDARRASRQQLKPEIAAQVATAKGDQISGAAIGGLVHATAAAPAIEARASRQDYLNAQRFAGDSSDSANTANLPSAPASSANGLANAKQSTLLSGNWQPPSNAYLAIPEAQTQTSHGVLAFTPPPPEHQSLLSKIVEVGKRPIKRVEPALQAQNVSKFAMTFTNGQAIQRSDVVAGNDAAEASEASNLSKSPAFTARGFGSSRKSFLAAASPYRWKVTQGKLLKSADSAIWKDAYPATDGIEFSAVTANGSQIWAGGNRGQLVHSLDGGTTWEKAALGDATVGNVVSIEIQGLNVHVVTAPSQGWSSLDGGKTWIKLPQ